MVTKKDQGNMKTKNLNECTANLLCLKNSLSSFVYGLSLHQMQLLNLYPILYYFEIHLLSYLSLAQHTNQLYLVLYFSYPNLLIIGQIKNPMNVGFENFEKLCSSGHKMATKWAHKRNIWTTLI